MSITNVRCTAANSIILCMKSTKEGRNTATHTWPWVCCMPRVSGAPDTCAMASATRPTGGAVRAWCCSASWTSPPIPRCLKSSRKQSAMFGDFLRKDTQCSLNDGTL